MEIKLMRREISVWQAESLPRVQTSFTAESVVPDTSPDVGKILTVRGGLFLKGKDVSPRGITVSGEARAAVLYLSEDGNSLGTLKMKCPFQADMDTENTDEEALPQISFHIKGIDTRILNPRRLAADFHIVIDGESFKKNHISVEDSLPEGENNGLHLLSQDLESWALTGVSEKNFALREQFVLPSQQSAPVAITGEEIYFRTLDCQQVGDRAVLKGELHLSVWGLSETGNLSRFEFSLPYSQLLNTGEGSAERFRILTEPCETWLELSESVDGSTVLNAEIHAVAQLCSWRRVHIQSIADAYSNLCPCEARTEEICINSVLEHEKASLKAVTRVELPGDLEKLDAVLPLLGGIERDGSSASMTLDLVYMDHDGRPATARRSIDLTGEKLSEKTRLISAVPLYCRLQSDGEFLAIESEAELDIERRENSIKKYVSSVELKNDVQSAPEFMPDLVLARRSQETLWTLAKEYCSSIELIESCNEPSDSLLLIPRERV